MSSLRAALGGGEHMKDLTDSSIIKNILQMALPIAAGMFFQTLYFLIDLYFVAGLGDAAIAGVGAAGHVVFVGFGVWILCGPLLCEHAGRERGDRGRGN